MLIQSSHQTSTLFKHPQDVILNGGEAAVKDRTNAGSHDAVDETVQLPTVPKVT
jgi:hypothetical protein